MRDFNLQRGTPTISADHEILKQEIDLLFSTRRGDLMGEDDYGTDYSSFLFELQTSAESLKAMMESDINSLDELFGYTPKVTVTLHQGTQRDIALVEVSLTSPDLTSQYKTRYNIS